MRHVNTALTSYIQKVPILNINFQLLRKKQYMQQERSNILSALALSVLLHITVLGLCVCVCVCVCVSVCLRHIFSVMISLHVEKKVPMGLAQHNADYLDRSFIQKLWHHLLTAKATRPIIPIQSSFFQWHRFFCLTAS